MIKNYLTIALRNLIRQKVISAICILSLALGISVSLLVFVFVKYEFTYDNFHEKSDRVYRILIAQKQNSEIGKASASVPVPLGPTLVQHFPEIEESCRVLQSDVLVKIQNEIYKENVTFVDTSFFNMFSFSLIQGDPNSVFRIPNSVLLTERLIRKFFGDAALERSKVLGKELTIQVQDRNYNVVVSGIINDPPANSSIRFNALLPISLLSNSEKFNAWTNYLRETYVLAHRGHQLHWSEAFDAFVKNHWILPESDISTETSPSQQESPVILDFEPIQEVHFSEAASMNSRPRMISYILSGVAFCVLAIGCINFVSLAIGRSTIRAKEAGLRKIVGAQRHQLMVQFWGEAFVLSLIALLIGIAIVELSLPAFGNLIAFQRDTPSFHWTFDWITVCFSISLLFFTSLLSGIYPAFLVSRFSPALALKERISIGGRHYFGKILVITQFSLSVFFLICSMVFGRQLSYMYTKDIGFDAEQIAAIETQTSNTEESTRRFERYLNALEGIPHIGQLAGISVFPGQTFTQSFESEGKQIEVEHYRIDENYVSTLGLKILHGNNLASDYKNGVLVNETFVKTIGWANPVGKQLPFRYGKINNPTIIGVVEDFHFEPVHIRIAPLVLHQDPESPIRSLLVRIPPNNIPVTVEALKNAWKMVTVDALFKLSFIDEEMDREYHIFKKLNQIVSLTSVFTIVMACLGLFGLALLTVNRRNKEIGIRKVLGASVSNLTLLLSRDFLKLVVLANFIACPLAYWVTNQIISFFPYRISINVGLFLAACALSLLLAFLTVSNHTIKLARRNPVDALREE